MSNYFDPRACIANDTQSFILFSCPHAQQTGRLRVYMVKARFYSDEGYYDDGSYTAYKQPPSIEEVMSQVLTFIVTQIVCLFVCLFVCLCVCLFVCLCLQVPDDETPRSKYSNTQSS